MALQNRCSITNAFQFKFSFTTPGLLDRLPPFLRNRYESDFYSVDEGFYGGRMEETTKKRKAYWKRWVTYVLPLGVDPYLQQTPHKHRVRALSGFAARVRSGAYGRGKQIRVGSVSSAITAIGTTIALAYGVNPTKVDNTDQLLPRLAQMFMGWKKQTNKQLKKLEQLLLL
jgi:hypothetical protein